MADLTIESGWICTELLGWERKVEGSKGKTYTVRWDERSHKHQGEVQYDYSCDCEAYKFRPGYCKHIKAVRAEHCQWQQMHDGDEPVENKDGELRCPKCGAEVTAMRYGV
jgi:hypothetical protein